MSMETRKVLLSPPASAQLPAILLGHAIGSHFDTFGFGVLLPPTSTTILDPDSETKRRSSEDPGGPASALGWSRGWDGRDYWRRLMRLETSFLMRRLLVACCRCLCLWVS